MINKSLISFKKSLIKILKSNKIENVSIYNNNLCIKYPYSEDKTLHFDFDFTKKETFKNGDRKKKLFREFDLEMEIRSSNGRIKKEKVEFGTIFHSLFKLRIRELRIRFLVRKLYILENWNYSRRAQVDYNDFIPPIHKRLDKINKLKKLAK